MIKFSKFLSGTLLMLISFIFTGCGKNTPDVYSVINIPDGELLCYGNYINGKKYEDCYAVTEKVSNGKGGLYYYTYIDIISAVSGKKPPENYTNWPSYCIIDPKSGETVESEANLSPEDLKNWILFDGFIYWHYKLNNEKREVDYISKTVKGNVTNETKYKIKLRDYRSSDMWMNMFHLARFLDFRSGGAMDIVNPVYYAPAPFGYNVATNETIQTKAGVFHVIKYTAKFIFDLGYMYRMLEDIVKYPDSLNGDITKQYEYYVEDSDRRLPIQTLNTMAGGGDYILEVISNVRPVKSK